MNYELFLIVIISFVLEKVFLSQSRCICDYNETENMILTDSKEEQLFSKGKYNPVLKSSSSSPSSIDIERETYAKKMLSYMDATVDPCDDFYQYACGNYFENYPIKSGYHAIDNWMIVGYEIDNNMHGILSDKNKSDAIENVETKAKQFYQSCMNVDIFNYSASKSYRKVINSLGGWPAKDLINWNENEFDWFKTMIVLKSLGIDAFIYEAIDYEEEIIVISAKHYGLIAMNADDFQPPYSSTYHINKKLSMFIMKKYGVDEKNAEIAFNEIMEFGKFGTTLFENLTDSPGNKLQNITIAELIELVPEIPEMYWETYFTNIFDYSQSIRIDVEDINYLKILFNFIENTKQHVVANFLILKLLFELHDEYDHPKYQDDYCLMKTKKFFGPVIDSIYMRSKYRNERAEQEVLSMSSYIKNALQDILKSKKWLDKSTKKNALKKLKSLFINVDDVDFTLDIDELNEIYDSLEVHPTKYYKNNLLALEHYNRRIHTEFFNEKNYYTTDVNAFYDETKNIVILPAGILHKPLYYSELPKSYNFGVMGGRIIGHEIMHAFDTECINYDENGKKRNWWTIDSRQEYENRTQCLIEQYDKYKIAEINEMVDGEKTLGENLSDNGGVKLGYYGYKKWLKANEGSIDMKREILPGINLTNTQLYFLSYGQGLCGIYKRKGFKKMTEDVHNIEKWRTIGSLVNFNEFSKEFNCKLGTPMNPREKCVVW